MSDTERKLAAHHLLGLADYGNPVETTAQFIASMHAEASQASVVDLIGFMGELATRVSELLAENALGNPGIWEDLLPGPVRDPSFVTIPFLRTEPDAIISRHNVIVGEVGPETVIVTPPNIVLNYKMEIMRLDTVGRWTTNRAEFFMDEHGIQWVKFYPDFDDNEHMLQTARLLIKRLS